MGREFNAHEFRDFLQGQEYSSVFWTGYSDEQYGETKDIAQDVCEKHNENLELGEDEWKTLEMQLDKAGFDMPAFEENADIWKEASGIYAEEASGDAYVIKGDNVNPKGVFNTEELPALRENGKCDNITTLNLNGKETGESESFNNDYGISY